jgi:hypothetical protein
VALIVILLLISQKYAPDPAPFPPLPRCDIQADPLPGCVPPHCGELAAILQSSMCRNGISAVSRVASNPR